MASRALTSFDTEIGRRLAADIETHLQGHKDGLAAGTARVENSADATAQNYAEAVGYVRALNAVLAFLREIEDEMMGRGKKSGVPS